MYEYMWYVVPEQNVQRVLFFNTVFQLRGNEEMYLLLLECD